DHLQIMYYDALILSTGEQDTTLMNTFSRLGAKKTHTEYILTRDNIGSEEIYTSDPIELVLVQDKEDGTRLAEVHVRCFDSDLELMTERFAKTITMPNRRCFLALHHGKAIGAAHVRIDGSGSACLHDIGIVPEKQNFGFGVQLLKLVLNTLIADGQTQFHMVVAADNQRALKLYQRCHFTVEQAYQFWRMDKHFTFPPHYTLPKRKH
ncbi:MAG: N-terminal acetyltransferase, family, partial [Gammaproteobacteria bacterium]|nr:N-terminal acetyltransferase, family [Gammaproteobacteria bacterium]